MYIMDDTMKTLSALRAVVLGVLTFMVFNAHATLTTIGHATYNNVSYKLIWDNDNNGNSVVWLDYTNRLLSWSNQNDWAAATLDHGAGRLTYSLYDGYSVDWGSNLWRLPTTANGLGSPQFSYDGISTNAGWNITNSEMGHLFYTELGNLGQYDTAGTQHSSYHVIAPNYGPFENLKSDWYWSGTRWYGFDRTWAFELYGGIQAVDSVGYNHYGMALRNGQVTYSGIPEPTTLLLIGFGLAGLASLRRIGNPKRDSGVSSTLAA